MSTPRPMTKSPLAVARKAMAVAEASLPRYSSTRSRKDYTQHQLFAALALRQFFKTDYRGGRRRPSRLGRPAGCPRADQGTALLHPRVRGRPHNLMLLAGPSP